MSNHLFRPSSQENLDSETDISRIEQELRELFIDISEDLPEENISENSSLTHHEASDNTVLNNTNHQATESATPSPCQ